MYPKPSFGGTFGWAKRACNAFSGARFFSLLPCRLWLCLVLLEKSKPGGSSGMWGCMKAPLGSTVVPKAFLWGHFWVGEWGWKHLFCGPSFQSSSVLARDIFRVARKIRTRKVQLHVGLRKGSHGEFSCTQSLPLVTLSDGSKGLETRFLGPGFSVFSHAG